MQPGGTLLAIASSNPKVAQVTNLFRVIACAPSRFIDEVVDGVPMPEKPAMADAKASGSNRLNAIWPDYQVSTQTIQRYCREILHTSPHTHSEINTRILTNQ